MTTSSSFIPAGAPWTTGPRAPQRRSATIEARLLATGLLLFALVWLLHLDHASLTPPADNIEQLNWVASLEAGYYKHPPLPTWLFWLPVRLFGASAWTTYLSGAAFTLAAMALLWTLLARLRGARHATLAVLATLCVTFYNGRLHYYNHNVVLLPFVTASALLCWQACSTQRLRWWAALGVCLGLGMLAKYQMALAAAAALAFWTSQGHWRVRANRRGLLLAALLALLVALPHLRWLPQHGWGPVRYAMDSSLGIGLDAQARLVGTAHWLLDQLFNRALPAWLLLALAARASSRRRHGAASTASPPPPGAASPADAGRSLLMCFGVLPLLSIAAMGTLLGADLQFHWGTAFLPLTIAAAMELPRLRDRWTQVPPSFAWTVFASIQLALLLVSHLTSPHGPAALQSRHWRNFDSAVLAESIAGRARERLGGTIRVVIGPGAQAGALALRLAERPLVLIDGRHDYSPWVNEALVGRCGALELGTREPPPADAQPAGGGFTGLWWRVVEPTDRSRPCRAE